MSVRSRTGVLGKGTPRVPPALALNSLTWLTETADATVTLPASPLLDDVIVVKADATVGPGNPVTINGNGNTIDGLASRQIAAAYGAMWLRWSGVEWQIV